MNWQVKISDMCRYLNTLTGGIEGANLHKCYEDCDQKWTTLLYIYWPELKYISSGSTHKIV